MAYGLKTVSTRDAFENFFTYSTVCLCQSFFIATRPSTWVVTLLFWLRRFTGMVAAMSGGKLRSKEKDPLL